LTEVAGERVAKAKTWPDAPRALSGRLRRAAPFLRKVGIGILFEREGRARTRTITLTCSAPDKVGTRPSTSSASSASLPEASGINEFAGGSLRTVDTDADDNDRARNPTVRANLLNTNGADDADGSDANSPAAISPEKMAVGGWRGRV
jgi:hypothetical protein